MKTRQAMAGAAVLLALTGVTGCGGHDKKTSPQDAYISQLQDGGFDTSDRAGAIAYGKMACQAMDASGGDIDQAIAAVRSGGIGDETQARRIALAATDHLC